MQNIKNLAKVASEVKPDSPAKSSPGLEIIEEVC
jgi:hypothetical protein